MSLSLKVIYGCLIGAWGGFVGWLLLDPLLGIRPSSNYVDALINGALIGGCVGGLLGGYAGLLELSLGRSLRGLATGLIAGLAGGAGGLVIGEIIFQSFGQADAMRLGGWAVFGFAIGAAEGVLVKSNRRISFGAAGGLVGGVLGGLAFLSGNAVLDIPTFGRALGFTVLGAMIGLFIGLALLVASKWIGTLKVVSSGRNEGKEMLLDKYLIRIGRDDGGDFGLYGDRSIEPRHAELRREGNQYVLYPVGNALVLVNGQPIVSQSLRKGDRLRIGGEELLFR